MDPELRRRMIRYYRVGATVGIFAVAVGCGLLLGGNRSPALVGFTVCTALFAGGQLWARRRL